MRRTFGRSGPPKSKEVLFGVQSTPQSADFNNTMAPLKLAGQVLYPTQAKALDIIANKFV